MHSLTLKAGGVLAGSDHVVIEEPVEYQRDSERDAAEDVRTMLQRTVAFEGELTVLDLFSFLRGRRLLHSVFEAFEIKAQVEEVFRLAESSETSARRLEGIEYLEFFQLWKKNSKTGELFVDRRLHCQAVGFELQEDLVSEGILVQKKEERLHKDVRFVPVQQLLNLPVRISPVISIYEADEDSDDFGDTIAVCVDELPTLYALIQCLLTRNPRYGVSVPPSYEVSYPVLEKLEYI